MKILLSTTKLKRKRFSIFPLGLCYVATALYNDNHNARIFDSCLSKEPIKDIGNILEEFKPDIVGVSVTCIDTSNSYEKSSYMKDAVSYIKSVKKMAKTSTIIVGGSGFSLCPAKIMNDIPEIDFGIYLEGEETSVELLNNLSFPSKTKGIFYRNKGRVFFSGERQALSFDNLPFLRRDFLNVDNYGMFNDQMGVQTKRGCVFGCIYCTYPFLNGKSIRLRDPYKVVDEIERLSSKGIKKFFFVDSVFNFPKEHAEAICKEILERNIKIGWRAFFNEKFIDRGLILLAKESGCNLFMLGTDGASTNALRNLNKVFTFPEVNKAYSLFREIKSANFDGAFIFNIPGDNLKSIINILKLIIPSILTMRFRFHITNMRIYPNTSLHKLAIENGIIKQDADLLLPIYYDPWPLKFISYFVNFFQKILYFAKLLYCSFVIKFNK